MLVNTVLVPLVAAIILIPWSAGNASGIFLPRQAIYRSGNLNLRRVRLAQRRLLLHLHLSQQFLVHLLKMILTISRIFSVTMPVTMSGLLPQLSQQA